jgi:hypothetical protein
MFRLFRFWLKSNVHNMHFTRRPTNLRASGFYNEGCVFCDARTETLEMITMQAPGPSGASNCNVTGTRKTISQRLDINARNKVDS